MPAPALQIDHLSKTFPGTRALNDVDLHIAPGEIHGLVGENGSGKSTLIKCLAGVHRPDPGSHIEVTGVAYDGHLSPEDVRARGLAFVHQDLGLIPDLTVTENLALGYGFVTGAGNRIHWAQQRAQARELLTKHGVDIDPDARVRDLSPARRTLLAIVRALQEAAHGGQLLVLDEPTAALPDGETDHLFDALSELAADGVAILYVSHRLAEIMTLTDRVTVLRNGRVSHRLTTHEASEADLVQAIVGGRPDLEGGAPATGPQRTDGPPRLEVRNLHGPTITDVSFDLHAGEIVGIAGLAGSGRSELARLLFGAQRRRSGVVRLDGRETDFEHPADAIAAGVAMTPQDRHRDGVFLNLTVTRNVALPSTRDLFTGTRMDSRGETSLAERLGERFSIRPRNPSRKVATLSGGNQQKTVVAKWLHRSPRLVIFDEPVQGVDVGAKAEIFGHAASIAASDTAVLLIDAEFENLAAHCHRVLVMRRGRIVRELAGDEISEGSILQEVFHAEATYAGSSS